MCCYADVVCLRRMVWGGTGIRWEFGVLAEKAAEQFDVRPSTTYDTRTLVRRNLKLLGTGNDEMTSCGLQTLAVKTCSCHITTRATRACCSRRPAALYQVVRGRLYVRRLSYLRYVRMCTYSCVLLVYVAVLCATSENMAGSTWLAAQSAQRHQ